VFAHTKLTIIWSTLMPCLETIRMVLFNNQCASSSNFFVRLLQIVWCFLQIFVFPKLFNAPLVGWPTQVVFFSYFIIIRGKRILSQKAKMCTQTIQNEVTKKCSIYQKYKKNKKRNRHQHNTDDGRQAMGEEMRHVQMSRWGKHICEESKQQ